jgi:hypothetical protein
VVSRLHAPDDEDKPFIARWNVLIRILLLDPSVKAVARSAIDFADFDDGSSCHPSNKRIERETGLSDRTVRTAWQVLRGLGLAERVAYGSPHRRLADEYQLVIPDNWRNLPVYGPHVQDFHCLYCDKQFTPQGNCTVAVEGGKEVVSFRVHLMAFCPPPRAKKGRDQPYCLDMWNDSQAEQGQPRWGQLGGKVWAGFRKARGDNW